MSCPKKGGPFSLYMVLYTRSSARCDGAEPESFGLCSRDDRAMGTFSGLFHYDGGPPALIPGWGSMDPLLSPHPDSSSPVIAKPSPVIPKPSSVAQSFLLFWNPSLSIWAPFPVNLGSLPCPV